MPWLHILCYFPRSIKFGKCFLLSLLFVDAFSSINYMQFLNDHRSRRTYEHDWNALNLPYHPIISPSCASTPLNVWAHVNWFCQQASICLQTIIFVDCNWLWNWLEFKSNKMRIRLAKLLRNELVVVTMKLIQPYGWQSRKYMKITLAIKWWDKKKITTSH